MNDIAKTALKLITCILIVSNTAHAQISLKRHIYIQTKQPPIKLTVEIAQTPAQRAKGLMFRENLPANQGMLFIYPKPSIQSMWMKHCKIPLTVAFIDCNQKIINIEPMKVESDALPDFLRKQYSAKRPACFALEANTQWFIHHNIKANQQVLNLPDILR